MKWVTIGIVMLGTLAALFFMFAPESRVNAVEAEWARLTGDTAQICFDQYSDRLKDPDSARVLNSYEKDKRVYIIYKAKNDFGAYSKGTFDCPLKNGKVDKIETSSEKLEAMQKRLK